MLQMTFKKHVENSTCCFFAGKVLDLSFGIVTRIRNYIRRNQHVTLNTIQIMKDLRDYST